MSLIVTKTTDWHLGLNRFYSVGGGLEVPNRWLCTWQIALLNGGTPMWVSGVFSVSICQSSRVANQVFDGSPNLRDSCVSCSISHLKAIQLSNTRLCSAWGQELKTNPPSQRDRFLYASWWVGIQFPSLIFIILITAHTARGAAVSCFNCLEFDIGLGKHDYQ